VNVHDGLKVSVSQLKEFVICPRRYQLHRVLGVEPAFVPVPLALGSAAHQGFAAAYSSIQTTGEVAPLESVVQVFRDAWTSSVEGPVPLKLDEDDADPVDVGVKMIEAFHSHLVGSGAVEVVAVELPFAGVELHDPDTGEVLDERLTGVMDLVVREHGKNVVVEHKTAARKWTRDQVDYDFQVTAYQTAARATGLGDDVGLRFQVVTKAKLPTVQVEDVVRDDMAELDFLRTSSGILRAIGAGAFWPVRSWACRSCPYSYACSVRR